MTPSTYKYPSALTINFLIFKNTFVNFCRPPAFYQVVKKERTDIKTTRVATVVTTTTTTTTTKSTDTTTTTVTPSSNLIALAAKFKEIQAKIKALTSFSQISVSVAFNCAISFPDMMTKVTDSLSVVNLDVVPKLQLQCRMPGFDYIDKMVQPPGS